jgi:RimJ/RimL family protein N-acetyltransferase
VVAGDRHKTTGRARARSASGRPSTTGRSSTRRAGCCSPPFHGRGLASAALGLLLDGAREEPRFEQLHAWPAVANAASNALCRRFGFELLGEEDGGYRDAPLRVNHWVLTLRP